ncbi:MAG: phenylalanine--tRNA ligase subunit beta [Bacteroidales bacterium]|nr:phenylalanine--tRNA ligase subunit beta [Bacteroidales bacterium]
MKISYKWLKTYANIDLAPEEVSQYLTDTGLEVEGLEKIETVRGGLEGIVIGEVKTCIPHPDSDHLHITTVDVGGAQPLDVVCGAANVAAGQKVVVATVGATMYNAEEPFKIKKSKIRGAVSEGMICAEDELCLGTSHAGIMVLPNDAVVGMAAKEYFHIEDDYVIEIGLTPNRTDAICHIGVARDLLAALRCLKGDTTPLQVPSVEDFKPDNHHLNVDIDIEDTEACSRYTGVLVEDITVAESPEWLQNRLRAIGLRPINNVVDISNYVLWEVGQPLHIFDLEHITGNKIIIRKPHQGTKFVTLDGVERSLSGKDLMICNSEEPMCIAGVFGGLNSGVTEKTKSVFIESAYFNPTCIRKTARFHGLKTDASFRFERGADIEITVWAAQRAALLLKEICGGKIASDIIDVCPQPIQKVEVDVIFNHVQSLIGKNIEHNIIKDILQSLDFVIVNEWSEGMRVVVPGYRVDVTREADVIEEILRIYGYNNVELPEQLTTALSYHQKNNSEELRNKISDFLSASGYNEMMCNSLMSQSWCKDLSLYPEEKLVKIINPLSSDLDIMRPTMLAGGMDAILYNINRKNTNLSLYEFGKTYRKNDAAEQDAPVTKRYEETTRLAIFLTGNKEAESWKGAVAAYNFFDLKNIVLRVLLKLGIAVEKLTVESVHSELFFEGLVYWNQTQKVVELGQVAPMIAKRYDLKQPVFFAEFDWEVILKLLSKKSISYKPIAKFPAVRRDLALLLDPQITFLQVENLALQTEKKFLKKVSLFDIYMGDKLPSGRKSYAVSFMLQDEQKTLDDKQIERIMNNLIKAFTEKLGAEIR